MLIANSAKPSNSHSHMLDAQREAFGGVRPMVNMNQLGEAAGTTAYLALSSNTPIPEIDPRQVRALLAKGGSVVI